MSSEVSNMADSNQDRKDASQAIVDDADVEHGQTVPRKLARDLQGRHMQMIAIGKSLAPSILDVPELKRLQTAGAMGAGLFVGTGSSLQSGGREHSSLASPSSESCYSARFRPWANSPSNIRSTGRFSRMPCVSWIPRGEFPSSLAELFIDLGV